MKTSIPSTSKTNHKVLEVHEKHIVCENKEGLWWLGSSSTFKLPKDNLTVKVNDIITLNLTECN